MWVAFLVLKYKILLDKAYTLTNDMSYKELCDVFGKPPFVSNASGFETYYYFVDH